jgi:hypothetical protein
MDVTFARGVRFEGQQTWTNGADSVILSNWEDEAILTFSAPALSSSIGTPRSASSGVQPHDSLTISLGDITEVFSSMSPTSLAGYIGSGDWQFNARFGVDLFYPDWTPGIGWTEIDTVTYMMFVGYAWQRLSRGWAGRGSANAGAGVLPRKRSL